MSEASYRYKAVDGTCKYSASEAYKNVVVVQHNFVAVDDVSALQAAIAQQPISVGIDATCLAFRFYSSGEQGYIKIAAVRGKGICGIQMDPLYPVLQ